MVYESTDSKVYEYGLVVVINHNVVRFDISVNNFYDFVTIINSLKHIDEIQSHVILIQANLMDIFFSALSDALFLKLFVYLPELIAQTTFGVVLGHQINVIFFWIVYNFLKPYNIWMSESFKDFLFLLDTFVGIFIASRLLFHQLLLVHLLDGKLDIGLTISA